MGILIAIKNAAERGSSFEPKPVEATFPEDSEAVTPLSFRDYVTALRAERVCLFDEEGYYFKISGLKRNGVDWVVPNVKCDSRRCTQDGESAIPYCEYNIIALTGINGGEGRANVFKGWVETKYPAILDEMPFDYPLIRYFDSPKAMDDYVVSKEYGKANNTKIAMGIVFDGGTPGEWNYWLRQNATNFNAPEQEGRPASLTTPDTAVVTDSFARDDESVCVPQDGTPLQGPFENSCTGQYM